MGGKAACDTMLQSWGVVAEALTRSQGVVCSTGVLAAGDCTRQAALLVKPCQAVLICFFGVQQSTADMHHYGREVFAASVQR